MKDCFFTGACTALVTPFAEGKINYSMAAKLLNRQMDAGIRAVVLTGTTGESPTLSDQEKIEFYRWAKEYVGSSCKIIAGTGSNSTEHAVKLSMAAEKAGADGVLVVSPYYNKANTDGLYMHYWTIAQAVSIPVILYNVPSRTGVDIPVSVYQQLSKISNIAGVKEAGTNMKKISEIISACGPDFFVWSGNDDLIVPVMALGGKGVISVLSNVYPAETAALCSAALRGDYQEAAKLQRRYLPLIDLLFCEVNPLPVKEAMKAIGYDCGSCRLPLTQVTEEHKRRIHAYFA